MINIENWRNLEKYKQSDEFKIKKEFYDNYLLSDKWKNKKNELIAIFWNNCEACWSNENLQCHHWCYKKVWDEPLHHLFLLCDLCHREYHRKHNFFVTIEQTEYFISEKLWLMPLNYYKIRKKILKLSKK